MGGTREPGGVHVHTADVAQTAAALGCQVTVASLSIDFFSSLLPESGINVEIADRLCIEEKYHRPRRSIPGRYRGWFDLMRRHRGSDVVLVEGTFAQTPALELPVITRSARRLYAIAHSPGLPRRESPLQQRLHGAIMGRGLHRLITVSEEICDVATGPFHIDEQKIAVCTNWISPSFQPPAEAERTRARHRLGLPADALILGYVGRLSGDKLGERLLRAFAAVLRDAPGDVRLIVAGDGWKADAWREAARNLGIARRVHFAGWQKKPSTIYNALDAFILPSLAEGFPLGIMEAMASGVPGMVHPMGSTLALVEDGVSGFVADMSTAARFADGLRSVFACERAKLRIMGQQAAAHIGKHHSRALRLPAVLEALDIPLPGRALPPPLSGRLQFQPWDSAV
ncbi:MAG TPA: glycosyltransferase family 4 protein [Dongiaceae bacterium]|nr:glycosyltransferase family 4 protein [Dongiaceae bacterium]